MADQLSRYSKLGDILGGDEPSQDYTAQAGYYFSCLQSLQADIILLETQNTHTQKTINVYQQRLSLLKEERNEPDSPANESPSPVPTHPCPHCSLHFETPGNLEIHCQLVHEQPQQPRRVFRIEFMDLWPLK